MATTAKFRRPEDSAFQASLRELRKNAPNLYAAGGAAVETAKQVGQAAVQIPQRFLADPVLRGDFSAYAPGTYIDEFAASPIGQAIGREMVSTRNPEQPQSFAPAGFVPAVDTGAPVMRPGAAAPSPAVSGAQLTDMPAHSPVGATAEAPVGAFRTIRTAGQAPLYTNLSDADLGAALNQPQTVENVDTGRSLTALSGSFEGYSPQAFRPQAATAAPSAAAAPVAATPRTFEDVLGTLRTPRSIAGAVLATNLARGISQNEISAANRAENIAFRNRKEAVTQAAAATSLLKAQTDATKARAEVAKLNKEIGVNLEPYYTEVTDPDTLETTKVLAGFASKGGDNPVQVPIEKLNQYRQLSGAAETQEERDLLRQQFREAFFGG